MVSHYTKNNAHGNECVRTYQFIVKIKFYEMAMTDKRKVSAKSKTETMKIVNGNLRE